MKFATVLVPVLAATAVAQEPAVTPPPQPETAPVERATPIERQHQELQQTVAELRAKLKALETKLARDKKNAAAAARVVFPAPRAQQPAGAGIVLDVKPVVQARVAKVQLVRGGVGQFVVTSKPAPSPLVRGDYEKALDELDQAREEMATAEEIPEAMKALDRATKALMEARTALWKQRDEQAEADRSTAKPEAQPKPTVNEKSK